jgi:hypothetical protein
MSDDIELPPAALHLYPEDADGRHDPCYTPSAQGADGRLHQPYFTADQVRAAVLADRARDALSNAIDQLPKPYSTECAQAEAALRAALEGK